MHMVCAHGNSTAILQRGLFAAGTP